MMSRKKKNVKSAPPKSDPPRALSEGTPATIRSYCEDQLTRSGPPVIPDRVKVNWAKRLGKGANNVVFSGAFGPVTVAVRLPLRKSDTQRKGAAKQEALATLRAAQLGVGPIIYDAFFHRHRGDRLRSGLYLITEAYTLDFQRVLNGGPDMEGWLPAAAHAAVQALETLANDGMLLYDLKPSNIVIRPPARGPIAVRIVDYGSEFCEWQHGLGPTPVLQHARQLIAATPHRRDQVESADVLKHMLFTLMLTQFSATTTRHIYDDARKRATRAVRPKQHCIALLCESHLASLQGRHVTLLRYLLRHESVRDVLRHYLSRAHSGTRRVMRLARGEVREYRL